MSLFKTYKFGWKQIGVFKLALLSIGAVGGAYLTDFVKDYLVVFIVVAVISSAYVMSIALKQAK